MFLDDKRVPIGRHNWSYIQPTDTPGEELALSACKIGNQYTCNSGKCLDMSKRCNKILDCPDGSDELLCSIISFPMSYMKAHAPSTTKGAHNEINISAKYIIENIDFIDTVKMRIALTMSIQMAWQDNRLEFKNLHDYPASVLRPFSVLQNFVESYNSYFF